MTKRITAPPIVHLILVAMAYFGAAALALETFGTASPLWFANAIAVAALLRHPPSSWPAFVAVVYLGDVLAVHWFGDGGPELLAALCDAVEVTLAALLIHRLGGADAWFDSVRKAARMLAVCLFVPLVSAAGGALALSDSHAESFASLWRTWYSGTALGLLIVTPILLVWSDHRIRKEMLGSLRPAPLLGLAAGLVFLGFVVSQDVNRPALFLSFPVILVLTGAFGLLGATTAVVTVTAASLVSTLGGYGPLVGLVLPATNVALRVEAVQLFLFAMLFSSLPFAILLIQQRELGIKLRKAGEARSDFLAAMSHEIRTPMTAVLGMADLLRAEKLSPVQAGYVDAMRSSGRHLLSVINDILDFSRMESGKLEIEQIDFSLPDLLERLRSLAHPLATEKGLDLRIALSPHSPLTLRGDPTRIKQVLLNLVSNGIKFTHRGSVSVTVSQLPGAGSGVRFRFEVRDTGVGIAADKLEALFAPFVQADSSTARKFGGSGLGLAISKRLVDAMGGEIGVRSSPDLGSLFYFEVPLALGDPLNLVLPGNGASAQPVAPRHILIAEDVEINQVILRSVLGKRGHTLTFADNGAQAVALVEKQQFALVLMDVQMAVMDGVEATRRIRKLEGPQRDIPILGLTANVMARERARYLSAGMNDCLMKPIDWEQLEAAIERYAPPPPKCQVPQAREPASTAALLDARALGILRQASSAPEFESIVRTALATFERYAEAMVHASPGEAAGEAHKLKGSAGTLGFKAIAGLAVDIELAAAEGNSFAHLVAQLQAAVAATRAELVATAVIPQTAPTS